MFGQGDHFFEQCFINIRFLEQAHLRFDGQDRAHEFIKFGFGQDAICHQLGGILGVGVTGHIHVHARFESAQCGFASIFGVTLNNHVRNRKSVGDYKTIEAPFFAQDFAKQEAIACCGHIVQIHVCAHESFHACIHCGFERRQHRIAQL